MSTILLSEDVTLPDNAWLDSFDKLLEDQELLRLNNVVKKNVNISHNMNSSYENSSLGRISILSPIAKENQHIIGFSPLREHLVISEFSPILKEKSESLKLRLTTQINQESPRRSYLLNENEPISVLTPITLQKKLKALTLSPTIKFNHGTPTSFSILNGKPAISVSPPITFKENCQKIKTKSTNLKKREKRENIVHLDVPFNKDTNGKKNNKLLSCGEPLNLVSTPIKANNEPFECTVSPIDIFRFIKAYNCPRKTATKKSKRSRRVEIVDENNMENDEKTNSKSLEVPVIDVTVDSPWTILKKKRHYQHQVQFKEAETSMKKNVPVDDNRRLTIHPGKWRKSLYHIRQSYSNKLRGASLRKSINLCVETEKNIENLKVRTINVNKNRKQSVNVVENFKAKVLQFCEPQKIVTFKDAYTIKYLMECQKIGEGTFGEVFMHSMQTQQGIQKNSCQTVLKIIPIEGQQLVNGEQQKTFEQILPEIVITVALSGLNNSIDTNNRTNGFVNVQKIRCVKGKYPNNLIHLWEEYDARKESENEHPKYFDCKQQFIILELNNGGKDLESWTFRNAEQSYFMLQQIILTLAVGEEIYQFEHRDLHWGNILIAPTIDKSITYKLNGNEIIIPTKGIKMTIIDYTLSRIMYNNYCYYCDLSNEVELFDAQGDYQFDIYRMMKDILHNKWQDFIPKTNVFWISYIIDKLLNGVTYKNTRSSIHNQYIKKLHELNVSILQFNSCLECAKHLFVFT